MKVEIIIVLAENIDQKRWNVNIYTIYTMRYLMTAEHLLKDCISKTEVYMNPVKNSYLADQGPYTPWVENK